ncbi:hypothetical protein O6R05_03865 [Peptoniphilus equinus]|uniref:LysM domain-containing protein n=1 Tax=Peptoniphilus equinus TaxID=3016343 RepID=A0ABY7QVF3_9FIRM|nr:hypothetical protein [Peptoniphilus equinus]WBW50697.1 hypothetical protein O6R05_03865 [Peptoniphilus equinus]
MRPHKRYQINKLRAFLFLSLIFIFTTGVKIETLDGTTLAKDTHYIEHYVNAGETLWTIAEVYNADTWDQRELVAAIMTHNNVDPIIHQGQILEIPVSK